MVDLHRVTSNVAIRYKGSPLYFDIKRHLQFRRFNKKSTISNFPLVKEAVSLPSPKLITAPPRTSFSYTLNIGASALDWVDWSNNERLLDPIGDIPPAEYEDNYYRQLAEDEAA